MTKAASDYGHALFVTPVSGGAVADQFFGFLDPTAAHRLVQIRVRLEELGLRRHVRELGQEKRLFGVGHLEIDGRAFVVTQHRQVAEAKERQYVLRLLLAYLPVLRPIDQRVLHILESTDDRLFVGKESLLLHSFSARDLTADPAGVEDRLHQTRAVRPGLRGTLE